MRYRPKGVKVCDKVRIPANRIRPDQKPITSDGYIYGVVEEVFTLKSKGFWNVKIQDGSVMLFHEDEMEFTKKRFYVRKSPLNPVGKRSLRFHQSEIGP